MAQFSQGMDIAEQLIQERGPNYNIWTPWIILRGEPDRTLPVRMTALLKNTDGPALYEFAVLQPSNFPTKRRIVYVGETLNLDQRLQQHANDHDQFKEVHCVSCPMLQHS